MKRILSNDHLNESNTKRKYTPTRSRNQRQEIESDSDLDSNDTLSNNSYVSPKDVVYVSSDEDISEIGAAGTTHTARLNEMFVTLKNMFPNISEQALMNHLRLNILNKHCLDNAINYFITYKNNNEIIIDSDETQPSTSSAATHNNNDNHDVDFIQSLFPNIAKNVAIEVVKKVNSTPNMNLSNRNVKENLLVDYIISHKLNEIEEQDPLSPTANANKSSLEIDLDKVKAVIIDCDPDYLKDRLAKLETNPRRVELLIAELVEKNSYPKLKDYLSRVKKEQELTKYTSDSIDMDEFLKVYPDPMATFYDTSKEMSESYKKHCRVELANKFNIIAEESIASVLEKHKYHLTPAYRQLETAIRGKEAELRERVRIKLNAYMQQRGLTLENASPQLINNFPKIKFTKNHISYKLENGARERKPYPDHLDVYFFKELQFIKNESQIRTYLVLRERTRKERLEKGKLENTLLECPCCCDNELLDEDMLQCSNEHKYCKNCIKRYAEVSVGDCKYSFKCIDDKCGEEYDMNTLRQVLDPNMLSKVFINLQNEEIKKAGLANLESCQYCTYAAIIENPNEKVFRCLNPDCLKETCRLCKEPNHLPLRCNEIEKSDEVKMRTWIENKVTEAMIRQCYKCGKRFYKVEGCNMMHCVCGAQMCYLCRQPVKDYKHFSETTCKQYSDIQVLHQEEMEKAYKEAQELYVKEHPESAQIMLKHDPKKLLDELNKKKPNQPNVNEAVAAAQIINQNVRAMQAQNARLYNANLLDAQLNMTQHLEQLRAQLNQFQNQFNNQFNVQLN